MNENLAWILFTLIMCLTIFSGLYLVFHENHYQSEFENCMEGCGQIYNDNQIESECKKNCMEIVRECNNYITEEDLK